MKTDKLHTGLAIAAGVSLIGASVFGTIALKQGNTTDSLNEKILGLESEISAFVCDPVVETLVVEKEVPVNVTVMDTSAYDELVLTLEGREIIEDYDDWKEVVDAENKLIVEAISLIDSEDFKEELDDANLWSGLFRDEEDIKVFETHSDYEDLLDLKMNDDCNKGSVIMKVEVEDLDEEKFKMVDVKVKLSHGKYTISSITKH